MIGTRFTTQTLKMDNDFSQDFLYNKVVLKVRRLGAENGQQFQHNRGIECVTGNENLQNEITGTQTIFSTNFGGKLSFILSFLFPERLHCCYIYIFTAPTYATTIITLEPCALNAEFQHFILKFNKISLLWCYS
jgi:hypothetical protein